MTGAGGGLIVECNKALAVFRQEISLTRSAHSVTGGNMQDFMTKQGMSLCFLLTSLILINSQAVYAGATHSPGGKIGIDVTSPAHQERLSALPVQVKITFGIPLNTTTFSAKMNGQDVTERFTVTELGATASLNVHDGIRPSLDKNGKLKGKAPNLLQIEGRAKDTHKPYHATRHFFLNAPAESPKVVATITPAGGTITLPGYGSVAFPAGAFTRDQAVELTATSDPATAEEFDESSALYDVGVRLPYELRIDTGSQQGPVTEVAVTFEVPENFSAQVPADSGLRVMAQFWQDGGEEILDNFEGFEQPFYTAAAKRVTVQLPPEAFTKKRNVAGTYEAIVVLTSARLAQSSVSSTSTNQHGPPVYAAGDISRLAKLSLATQSLFSRITEFFFSSATAATGVCTGLRRFGPSFGWEFKNYRPF